MTVRDTVAGAVKAALANRDVRAGVGGVVLPTLIVGGLEAVTVVQAGYTQAAIAVALGIVGGLVGWYTSQSGPNVVTLDVSGGSTREAPNAQWQSHHKK